MSVVPVPISEMLLTVKSREVQRGLLAEMSRDREGAVPHFLAAAHLELVLADDYANAGQDALAFRSRLSAASSFWRAGRIEQARELLVSLSANHPDRSSAIQEVTAELERDYPA